ncbi:MAG: hypothetical protein LKE46_10030 [Clostridium sp.]|uniref:Uncharacterized protein n=1 Tax=Clostridium coskatii TaxID=1705578 RepID=A0A166T5K0_9CLOT|nr:MULTISPECIES: hypothetical protein [Clostridium]MCH3964602.1 hypothetical protein [Clostridium sp.]MCH4198563.1 hypothetical protein [Clostridium tyrobutyricum]MCH4238008.1 hypothetical protein [Clostridium tyrobutyricum]MCH4258902.1 hypothetical protein [Clostridium tyrobutyricum]MCI1239750.1 hypothetical protein [Clostridium tyrobutyricum]
MKKFLQISILLILLLLGNGCGKLHSTKNSISTDSWAYEKMITLNKINYVVTSEQIEKVDSKLGEVRHYSTNEKDFDPNNFSNYFKVGTGLYKIPNINTKDAIAVEIEKNKFVKASNTQLINLLC